MQNVQTQISLPSEKGIHYFGHIAVLRNQSAQI